MTFPGLQATMAVDIVVAQRRRRGLQRFRLTGVRDVGREIGRGSYAAVVELQFRGLKCAGKKLHRTLYDNSFIREQEGMLQRFETECEILSELRHPRVVQFMGVHFEAGSVLPVLVMEFLHTTLTACLDRYGTLPLEISYTILDDVATALCYLHGQNPAIIHRDLSTNNVLLTSDMRAKISDLGVATILNLTPAQKTQMTTCPGTPAYMPPEAIESNPTYDKTIDCFSYGVLIIHIFCGRWPLPGKANHVDPSNPKVLIPRTEAERRDQYLQEVGEDHPLMALIQDCLSNYPPHRPDAEEILRQVKEVADQHPPSFENKVELLVQQKVVAQERKTLQEQNRQLLSQLKRQHTDLYGLLAKERMELQLSELRRENQQLNSLLVAKSEEATTKNLELAAKSKELAAKKMELSAKREELTAKDLELAAVKEEMTAKNLELGSMDRELLTRDASIQAKEGIIHYLAAQRDQAMEYLSSKGQPHLLQPQSNLKWRYGMDVPVPMSAAHCTTIGDALYTGGGVTDDNKSTFCIFKYSVSNNKWSILPPCPTKWFGLGQVSGDLVTVGGCLLSRRAINNVFVFDRVSQQWKNNVIPPMPTSRARLCVVSHDSGLVAGGGFNNMYQFVSTVEVYKSETNQWYSTAPLPIPIAGMRAIKIRNSCYLFGGFFPRMETECGITNVFYIDMDKLFSQTAAYNDTEWKKVMNVPEKMCAPGTLSGSLLAIGGRESRKIHVYSPNIESWVHIADLPHELRSTTSALLPNGQLIVIGGNEECRSKNVLIGSLVAW